MSRGARVRPLVTVLLASALALAGCSGEDEGGATSTTGAGTDSQAPSGGDAGEETGAAAYTGPPTEPGDIRPAPGERSAAGGTSVVVTGDRAAFVLPSANAACTVSAATAVCQLDADAQGFSVQGGHLVDDALGDCSAGNANAIMINDGQGAWTCVEDPIKPQAWVAQGGWWAKANGSATTKVGNRTMAVLDYGSTLTVGDVTCSSAEDGVRCSNASTGRSFFLSRGGYTYG
ncbi:hypothetical protein GCM10011366_01330 [Ornithinimicrobium tianjinense]|uniref:Uncharacterized protein n=2 Tax=Ornithinimicrobium tianjinense TaxID=1195761 RepID=A0A917F083_9MICO|nr:hypothetical protein [Ornithinimicrobium tianjinense]GGF37567.1 hypothetical protein GCM10011366_01330 [Ornithinimicrobium tianjinense]